MRYFVIMTNGNIVSVTNVYKGKFYDDTYFNIGNDRFKYDPFSRIEGANYKYKYLHIDCFYKYLHDDWYITNEIKYLLFLNEEEDSDLNYFQSVDFNAGVIYASIDKAMGGLLGGSVGCIEKEIKLPKIQVVPKCAGLIKETEVLDATITAVLKHFAAVYGERFNIVMRHYDDPCAKQYIVFNAEIKRKEPIKEMTITEIEEALGYKIKVVGDR